MKVFERNVYGVCATLSLYAVVYYSTIHPSIHPSLTYLLHSNSLRVCIRYLCINVFWTVSVPNTVPEETYTLLKRCSRFWFSALFYMHQHCRLLDSLESFFLSNNIIIVSVSHVCLCVCVHALASVYVNELITPYIVCRMRMCIEDNQIQATAHIYTKRIGKKTKNA